VAAVRIVIACMLVARIASAAPSKADVLFAEGQKLVEANQIDAACDKFVASLELEEALGTRLNLADCRERQQRFADAYDLYEAVVDEAKHAGKQSQLEFARQRLAALVPKIVRVRIVVADATLAGLVVKLGTRDVPQAAWTRALAVAPGSFKVSASAPGREPFEVARDAAPGDQITVEIPTLAPHVEPAVVATPTPVPTPPPPRSMLAWYVGGAGVLVVASSVVLGVHAKMVYDGGNDQTAPMGNARIHTAVIEADVATGVFVVGAVAIAAATYLYVHERRTQVVPVVGGNSLGAAIVGDW
jgi:hypothetical protein